MAVRRIVGVDWGTASSTDALSGTNSISNLFTHSPGYAFRANPVTTAIGFQLVNSIAGSGTVNNAIAATELWNRFYYYANALPPTEEIFCTWITSANAMLAKLTITSGGVVKLYDSTSALLATAATTLVAGGGRFYKISADIHNGAAGAYQFWIDDVSQGSGTGNFTATTIIGVRIGKSLDTNGGGVDFFYDDYIHSDSAMPAAGGSVQLFLPAVANGTTQQWTGGTNTSDYTQVNAIPIQNANYVASTGAANDLCLFVPRDIRAYGVVPNVVNVVEVFTRGRNNTATTNATLVRLNSGASNSDTTTLNLGTSDKSQMGLLNETDPATSAAWTQAGFLAVQVGAKENNAQITREESIALMVDMSVYPNMPLMLSCGCC